jgi:hypothetical protein
MAAHRYWRIYVRSTPYGSQAGLSEIQFRGSIGGASLFGGGTPSAYTYDNGAAANAVDGNTSTYWQGGLSGYTWWKYDFGAGNEVDVAEIYMVPRSDAASIGPLIWDLQFSDDDTNWTTSVTYKTRSAWSGSTPKIFAPAYFPEAVEGGHRYWKLNVTATQQGSYVGFSEIELRASISGANQCGATAPGIPLASGENDPVVGSVDGVSGTYWQSYSGLPGWWAYDFGTAQKVLEIAIIPRVDVYTLGPTTFDVLYSDDGSEYTLSKSFTDVVWPNADQQLFELDEEEPPPGGGTQGLFFANG